MYGDICSEKVSEINNNRKHDFMVTCVILCSNRISVKTSRYALFGFSRRILNECWIMVTFGKHRLQITFDSDTLSYITFDSDWHHSAK